jgi:hypothetical protein
MKSQMFILSIFLVSQSGICQINPETKTIPSTPSEIKEDYAKRIKKDRLLGVYIPADLADAHMALAKLSPAESVEKFKNAEEAMVVKRLHFGLGKWISTNWAFYEGSRYSHYLKGLGITNPDDMIDFTLTTWHRSLNKKPLEVKPWIEACKEKRKKEAEKKREKGKVIKTEIKKKN